MSEVTAKIQLRHGTTAQWAAADPVLLTCELGFNTDTGEFRRGNDLDPWSLLVPDHYTISQITNLLAGKSDVGHTHDDRYYTEVETDALLSGKSNTGHTHIIANITGLQTELDGKVDENAPIVGATKTKITYDSKGLILSGADATTTDIAEGTRLYYTDERVDDRVAVLIKAGTGISWVYDDTAASFTPTVSLDDFDTDDLDEGASNLYYTDARANAAADARIALQKGAANGLAPLGADSKISTIYLPASVLGATIYQGTWNANTNSPALASGVGTKGHYYVATVAGATNLDGINDWKLGDWVIFNGTVWEKVDNTDAVVSVNGQIGIVVLGTADISETGGVLFFTDERAQDAVGNILSDAGDIDFTYDDAAPSISAVIKASSVTYGKIQDASAGDVLLGRDTAGAGPYGEITVTGGIEFTGGNAIRTTAFTGDVTKAAGGTALTIANDAVTFAKFQNSSAASRLLGRGSAAGAGDFEEITLSGLSMAGTVLTAEVTASSTNTFTNKRITKRVGTVASSATPSINTDNVDMFTITALAANITSFTTNLTGTPTEGQGLIIRILDNGTARTIAWGASFVARGVALPTTTVISKYLYVGFIYNNVSAKWECIASAQEA